MIDAEKLDKPLSDSQLANLLKQNGILLSRRTVAKYREELGIKSSIKRKKNIKLFFSVNKFKIAIIVSD